MSKVWELSIGSHTQKLFLIALADNASDEGVCWPSIRTLARKCDLSEPGVRRQIELCVQDNLISVVTGGGRKSNVYQFNCAQLNYLCSLSGGNGVAGCPKPQTNEGVTALRGGGNTVATNHNITVKDEPSLNHKGDSVFTPEKPKDTSMPEKLENPVFKAAWAEWEKFRREIGKKLTPTTIKKQLTMLARYEPDVAAAMLNQSMEKGWQGIFELRLAPGVKLALPKMSAFECAGR